MTKDNTLRSKVKDFLSKKNRNEIHLNNLQLVTDLRCLMKQTVEALDPSEKTLYQYLQLADIDLE